MFFPRAAAPPADWRQAALVFAAGAQQIKSLTLPTRLLSARVFADVRRFFDEVLPPFLSARGFPEKG